MVEDVVLLVATGFGLGALPWAPGTFGSLIGLPLAWWLLGRSTGQQVAIALVLLVVSVPLSHWASLWMGGGDVPQLVADEFLAFPIVMVGLAAGRRWWTVGLAFLLFRLFDITKLPPIGHVEAIGGGLGIALDDVVAALYALVVLSLLVTVRRRYQAA